MLRRLVESNRFKKEIRYFEREINKIGNDKARQRGLALMKKLRIQANAVDQSHDTSMDRKIDSENIREQVEIMTNIRKEISKLINEANT